MHVMLLYKYKHLFLLCDRKDREFIQFIPIYLESSYKAYV